ncbi:DUF550 domain-containing protein [Yersinia ruckeri]|uniref:DUF550 domain-containing protein n=1 Tax=Yersinia ruckeri TaxID=29486 RepID=UPI002237C2B8|nr:DUF550 domain-containing protein [Yersinia ruckeri]MCW6598651.1 DUF550 domain-containing protein [Yersinia ruckeri]
MSDEQKWFNHYPDQFEIWFPYNGLRYKEWYDIKLHDGTVHEMMYPNGIAWSGKTGRFEDSEVAEVRLVSNIRHPLSKNGNLIKTSWRVEHSYELFKEWIPSNPQLFDFEAFIEDKWQFSQDTFGPNYAIGRVIDHLRKEVDEVAEKPSDLLEWVDVINLAIDGALRSGHQPSDISKGLLHKLEVMKSRDWPDWRTADENAPIEHVRDDADVVIYIKTSEAKPFTARQVQHIQSVIDNLYKTSHIEGAILWFSPQPFEIQAQISQKELDITLKALRSLGLSDLTWNPGKILTIEERWALDHPGEV